MERRIGEIFELGGEWYQCIEHKGCHSCVFTLNHGRSCGFNGYPHCAYRSDGKSVIFKKLEKVGEQFLYKGKQMQSYIRATDELVCNWNNNLLLLEYGGSNIINIEIKQNQEDMEENKLKLKPFDLEAAKAGKPVCTRDGYKARIICFDAKGMHQPIVALVTQDNGVEYIETYYSNGRFNDDINSQSGGDLMMLPEKKEGWILLRKEGYTFDNEEVAKKNCTDEQFVAKVEWEE